MDTLFSKVAGLDVHLKTVQTAVRCPEVVVTGAEPEVLDECKQVVGEYVRWIPGAIGHCRAVSAATKVRENDAMPSLGEYRGRAIFEQLPEHLVARDRREVDHPAPAALDHPRHQLLGEAGGVT